MEHAQIIKSLELIFEHPGNQLNTTCRDLLETVIRSMKVTNNPQAFWESLTPEQRLSLHCCKGCGSLDTSCQCNNDE